MTRNMAVVPAGAGAFSDDEEEFFRAGATEVDPVVESFADLDEGYSPPSLWSRIVGRQPVRAATEPPPPPRRSATAILVEDDDDWDWQIAIARARHATANDAA
jgi:hypothetical protein